MLTIPAAIKTLLAGTSMVAGSRPTWGVTVDDGDGADAVAFVREIVIERQLYQASACQLVLDNKAARYAPDAAGAWYRHLWPNSELVVSLGYGADTVTVFTGLIDRVEMRRTDEGGAVMVVTARDKYKLCLDQIVTNPDTGEHVVTYSSEAVEDIFADLAEHSAGFAAVDIHTEATAITVSEKTFAWESVADAMAWCCEIAGFEVRVDEDGDIWFEQATDRQPEVADEALVLNGTAWSNLAQVQVVSGSDRVRSAVSGGGALYGRTTDYEIELGDPARIRRRVGGTIGDGATVYATYVYAAWVFQEGTSIFALGYSLDDDNLFNTIVVEGYDSGGNVVTATADTDLASWGGPANKVLLIRSETAATEAECQTIADRAKDRIEYSLRRCDFAAPGNPWLQLGDCIQIVETSTTISSIYRIVGMELRMDPSHPFTMQLETRYYGYTAAPA